MSNAFAIPQTVLPMALAAFEKGTKSFDTFAKAAEGVMGCTPAVFKAAFESVRVQAAMAESFGNVAKEATSYKVPKTILKILKQGAEHVAAFTVAEVKEGDKVTTPAFTPRVTFAFEYDSEADTAKLVAIQGRVSSRVAKGGTPGTNSRISAYVAWKRGAKAGDTFKVTKADKGYKVDGRFVPSRQNGGLAGYVLKAHPNSKTTEILKSYGYTTE